ncbi:MAG: hypothetical protein PWR16_1411 [Methanoculleus sp.]|nr:hypothetical protein [Methanoculleus sp.]
MRSGADGEGGSPPSKPSGFLMLTPFALPIVPTPLMAIATTVHCTMTFYGFDYSVYHTAKAFGLLELLFEIL